MNEDPAAERAVLSGLLQYGLDAHNDISGVISISSFYNNDNAIIFRCLENIFTQGKIADISSIVSSATELAVASVITSDENMRYIRSLTNFPSSLQNIRKEAIKLRKLELARDLRLKVKQIYDDLDSINGTETVEHIFSKAETPILDFTNGYEPDNAPQKIGGNIEEYVEFLQNNSNRKVGISSGYFHYDNAIGGGFRRKTVSLVGARVKTGKSLFADNVAMYTAGNLGIPTLMLDTEMTQEDHQTRMLAYYSKVPINTIESARFNVNELYKVKEAAAKIARLNYHYESIAGADFEDILGIARRWVIKEVGIEAGRTNDCLIVYDYLKLMSHSSISNNLAEHQVIGFQISELHNFTVKYDLPILSFVQLNRDGITKESTDVVSQSDRILWLCTNFSIFKTKSDEEIMEDGDENGNRKLIPLVSRHGPGMSEGNYINMHMQGEFAMIAEGQTAAQVRNTSNRAFDNDVNDGEL